jgi:2-amino-4,5-dihydroxy-6-oxo-7-(phosphonooxy)heptanoate synthase
MTELVKTIAKNGADAVVLHKGRVRFVDPACFRQMSLIIHLSASTIHAADVNAKSIVASVEECLRLGADAVSIHVNWVPRRKPGSCPICRLPPKPAASGIFLCLP